MNYAQKLGQILDIVATIDPASQAAGAANSTAVDMMKHRRVLFILNCGVLGASATVDFKLQGATTSGGAYSDITGKSITQLTKASNDGGKAAIEVTAEELVQALGAGYRYVKAVVTVGTADSLTSVIGIASVDRHYPAADNLATVAQVV